MARQVESLAKTLVNWAGPSISLVAETVNLNEIDNPKALIEILRIYRTLKSHSLGEPTTSIELFHRFLSQDLTEVSLKNCNFESEIYQTLEKDFFIVKLITIMDEIENFCDQKSVQSFKGKYTQFANYFNENIAGQFPFARGTNYNEIFIDDLEELKGRFRQLERDGLDLWTFSALNQDEIYTFINKLDAVLSFFDRISISETEETTPNLRVRVRFRTNRELERAAKHISQWELSSGGDIITHVDDINTFGWRYSDSIYLKLKWAENSIVRPAEGYRDGYFMETKNGNTVIQINGRWSLFRFIYTYSNPSICNFGKYCMEISTPINFISASNAKLSGGIMRSFIEFELLDKEGLITYPEFPVNAPMLKN